MSTDQISDLQIPFLEEEILRALKDSDGDKASSPDGFSFKFAQSFLGVFKSDLLSLFQKFYSDADFDY